jgi:hypothetical protein
MQAGRQQLAGAQNAKGGASLGAETILAALASRQGKIHGAHPVSQGEFRQQRGVFIIRVRPDHQHASAHGEPTQNQGE